MINITLFTIPHNKRIDKHKRESKIQSMNMVKEPLDGARVREVIYPESIHPVAERLGLLDIAYRSLCGRPPDADALKEEIGSETFNALVAGTEQVRGMQYKGIQPDLLAQREPDQDPEVELIASIVRNAIHTGSPITRQLLR